MRIKEINAYPKDLSLTKAYEVAYQITDKAENVIVEIILENGLIGYGAGSPSEVVINETIEDLTTNLQSGDVQQWIGRDIRQFQQIISELKTVFPKHSATRTALDIALHDTFGKFLGIPIVQFYGQKIKALPTSVTIGINTVAETLKEAQEYIAMGFSHLKVKTGKSVSEDVERCAQLRSVYGDTIQIRVDANQGYSAADTLAFYDAVKTLNLEFIEQPMPEGEEQKMRTLPEEVKDVIACDESLKNAKSALSLVRSPRVCGIFNIKLMKCGGLLGAFEIATIAKAAHVDLFWGCFDESRISIAAALHAAFACPHTKYIDLDGSLFLGQDVAIGGFNIQKGVMTPTDKPGFGFEMK
ncbi:MAG: dipeptide epimerase [Maribacter sp.]